MIINNDTLASLLGTIRMHYNAGLAEPARPLPPWAQIIPSKTKIERFPITMLMAVMREWKGARIVNGIDVDKLTLTNLDFELTWGIPTNDLADDDIGYLQPVFMQAGRNVANHPAKYAAATLVANGAWLDGTAFYTDAREWGDSGAIDNYCTDALSETTFNTKLLKMQSYLLPNGEPAGISPDLLVVGPKNRTVAHEILHQGPGNTASNANENIVALEVNPYLVSTYDDYWFLVDTKTFGPPVLMTERKVGGIVALDKPTDTTVFLGSATGTDGTVPGGMNVYGIHHRRVGALAIPYCISAGIL